MKHTILPEHLDISFVAYITKIEKEFTEIISASVGKPARYYHAYKLYSLYFNLTVLESLKTVYPEYILTLSQWIRKYRIALSSCNKKIIKYEKESTTAKHLQ